MAAIVGIVSRCTLIIKVQNKIKPNKSKLALYKPLIYFYNHLKQQYKSNKTASVIKEGVAYVGILVSKCLKQDTWLGVISNILLFKTVIQLRN